MLRIGKHTLRNPVLLAPMAGVTDVPFRQVAWALGAGYQMGEMVSDNPRLWNSAKSRLRRMPLYGCGPQVIQIAGSEPEQVAQAAELQWQTGADVLDINFGCPAKKVCRKAAGSALLADPQLVQDIAAAVVAAVPIPVTAKIRTGPAPGQQNAVEIGLRLQDAGVAALAIHGRTRACKFNGVAELDTVAAVKQQLAIPVFANGDITSPQAATRAMAHTKADGVMVGRGALGRPWVLGQMAAAIQAEINLERTLDTHDAQEGAMASATVTASSVATPSLLQIADMMIKHLQHLHEFYGLEQGVRFARKHMGWYLEQQGLLQAKRHFNRLPCASTQLDALALLQQLCNQHERTELPQVFAASLVQKFAANVPAKCSNHSSKNRLEVA